MSKINWPQALLGMTALTLAAVVIRPSAFEDPPTPPAPKVKTVVVTKIDKKVIEKPVAAVQPDGYMTEEDCANLPNGTRIADVVWKFGWPAKDYGVSAFSERLFYPVHDRRDETCVVRYDQNKVISTLYRTD